MLNILQLDFKAQSFYTSFTSVFVICFQFLVFRQVFYRLFGLFPLANSSFGLLRILDLFAKIIQSFLMWLLD